MVPDRFRDTRKIYMSDMGIAPTDIKHGIQKKTRHASAACKDSLGLSVTLRAGFKVRNLSCSGSFALDATFTEDANTGPVAGCCVGSLKRSRPGRVMRSRVTFTSPLRPKMEMTKNVAAEGMVSGMLLGSGGWRASRTKLIQRPMESGRMRAT
jgi:hypothetical protein